MTKPAIDWTQRNNWRSTGKKETLRSTTGSAAVELPMVMYLIFVLLAFPLINYTTLSARYALLLFVQRDALAKVAVAQSEADIETIMASFKINRLSSINGVTNPEIKSEFVTVLESTTTPSEATSTPERTRLIRLTVEADLQPLLQLTNCSMLGSIPGLNSPAHLTVTSAQYLENQNI